MNKGVDNLLGIVGKWKMLVDIRKVLTGLQVQKKLIGLKKRNVIQISTSTTTIKSGMNEANILMTSAVHGVFTGVKEYLSSYKISEKSYNYKSNGKQG